MSDGGRGRLVLYVLLLLVAGALVPLATLVPESWPWVVETLLFGTAVAIAGGATGTFLAGVIDARRVRSEGLRAAEKAEDERRGALVGTRELAASDLSVAGLLRPRSVGWPSSLGVRTS